MKAILVNEDTNRSLRWDNVPDPQIKSDEVLVKVAAAALNRADLMQREGDYPPPAVLLPFHFPYSALSRFVYSSHHQAGVERRLS